jgi:DNA-binding HxlR family transcriptional regulator
MRKPSCASLSGVTVTPTEPADPSDRDVPARRIEPGSLPGRPCSIAAALDLIGDRWSLLAIREVMFGNHRFSEIVRNTGAPRDRLAARLKTLVEAGVLERRQYQDSPPRSDYHLSDGGQALAPVLHALRQWGDAWAVSTPPVRLRHHDHVFDAEWLCRTCHQPADTLELDQAANNSGWDFTGPLADQA